MEQYKEKLKTQNRNTVIGCIIWAVVCLLGSVCEAGDFLLPVTEDSHWQSMWHGLISGASCGILLLMVIGLVRGLRALRDEKALKKLYIQETDERNIKIWTSARAASMQTFLMLGLVAGIVAGYFSMTVSITILVCVFIHSLISIGFKFYYSRKF